MSLKSLFCNHSYKVLSEHTETYKETIQEVTYVQASTLRDFWGQPIIRIRTTKTCVLSCDKCGKTKTITI